MALISKTGISNGNTIQPEHLTRIIDALNESGASTIIATGSFTGSFKGDGSQITGVVSASFATNAEASIASNTAIISELALSATTASYALTASYMVGSIASASYSQTTETASFINVINTSNASDYYIVGIDSDNGAQNPEQLYNFIGLTYNPDQNTLSVGGGVMVASQFQGQSTSAISSSYAVTASYALVANSSISSLSSVTSGTALSSTSASFAATASRSTTASFATSATSANQLVSVNRSVYEFTTTNATPYVQNIFAGLRYARYIKAIVIGNSNSGSLGGEFTKFYDHDGFGAGTTELSSTGTLSENIIGGTPAFSISDIAQWTATGVSGVNIDWRVILEYSTI